MSHRPKEPLRPQALLAQAARDAARRHQPTGLGLDSAAMRGRMVARLRHEGVGCEPVWQAMGEVPRHRFVDTALAAQAYEDTSLPIGHGQTISKPSVVARMLEWAFAAPGVRARGHLGRVLEVGTGCGYQTALLAHLARQVVSVERIEALHRMARGHLEALGTSNCRLLHADGMHGHAPAGPFDTIVAAAGADDLPAPWLAQLAPGGRLVAPTRAPGGGQQLVIVDRTADGLQRSNGEAVQFVPLKSGCI